MTIIKAKSKNDEIAYLMQNITRAYCRARGLPYNPDYARKINRWEVKTELDDKVLATVLSRMPQSAKYEVIRSG